MKDHIILETTEVGRDFTFRVGHNELVMADHACGICGKIFGFSLDKVHKLRQWLNEKYPERRKKERRNQEKE